MFAQQRPHSRNCRQQRTADRDRNEDHPASSCEECASKAGVGNDTDFMASIEADDRDIEDNPRAHSSHRCRRYQENFEPAHLTAPKLYITAVEASVFDSLISRNVIKKNHQAEAEGNIAVYIPET